MEKVIEILLNQYVFLFASALIIIGLTQFIKLIPCFKNNNWNVTFPVLFGYLAAFGWGLAVGFDIVGRVQDLILFGTGITTLSTFLYSILKKILSKDYKMDEELKKNPIYNYISNILTTEVKDFGSKTTTEKYGFIVSVVSGLAPAVTLLQNGKTEEAKETLKTTLEKFIIIGDGSNIVENILELIRKQYNIPVVIAQDKVTTLVKPQ